MDLHICSPGVEDLLAAELADAGLKVTAHGVGWVQAGGRPDPPPDPAFSHLVLRAPQTVAAEAVNALAQALAEAFLADLGAERVTEAWPLVVGCAPEPAGLGRRATAVRRTLVEVLQRRVGRLARLATETPEPGCGPRRGFFVHLTDFGSAYATREAWAGGQRRMADDPAAPSRSYLKIEEAYGVLGREPVPGETVCDLGAAPGGWSYSAVRREARVTAVDNGPLKGGALGHPLIRHRREDAFAFRPVAGEVYDWMFCDLVEEPHHVLRDLVEPWLAGRLCRRFVVMLKFGRTDPAALLRELRAADSPLVRHAPGFRVRHLFHDRDEFTVVGQVGR